MSLERARIRLADDDEIRVLRGERAILNARDLLVQLAERSGQAEVISDLHYFLRKPGLLKRIPVLLLICRRGTARDVGAISVDDLVGGVLLFDYGAVRLSARIYTSNDRSGRRTVLASLAERARVVASASEYLLAGGAHVVMFSFRSNPSDETRALLTRNTPRGSWTTRERSIRDYLALRSTFEETLASIGKRTRTHLRYYRRKAEAELGCSFDPAARISSQEILAFNRKCMFAVSEPVAKWRLAALEAFEDPTLMGIRDSHGQWLSLIGGRRQNGEVEILWQMNRGDLPAYSLTTVMRCYLIEHEVSRGTQRLYFEGGSGHSLCHSFVPATVTDIAVLRRSLITSLARRFARRFIPKDNDLAHLLVDEVRLASPDPAPES